MKPLKKVRVRPVTEQEQLIHLTNARFVVVRAESSPYSHMMAKRPPSPVQDDPRWGSWAEITLCGRKVVHFPPRHSDKGCNTCAHRVGLK